MEKGKLYIISLPIGNKDDISQRAIDTLKSVDLIVCEEAKGANKIFRDYDFKKEFFILNEHNEERDADTVISYILKGENAALISDVGTPVFADPGTKLVMKCHENKIKVSPVPGASCLMSALASCGFDIKRFYFAGFISKTTEERKKDLSRLRERNESVVIMETPYRIVQFLEDVESVFSKRKIMFFYKLTMPEELIIYDFPLNILKIVKEKELKGEFLIIIDSVKNKIRENKK